MSTTAEIDRPETLTALVARHVVASSDLRMGNTPTTCKIKNGSYSTDDHK